MILESVGDGLIDLIGQQAPRPTVESEIATMQTASRGLRNLYFGRLRRFMAHNGLKGPLQVTASSTTSGKEANAELCRSAEDIWQYTLPNTVNAQS